MLIITPIASGSSGNCYTVDNGNSRLMLECGLPFAKIKKALNFDFTGVEGVLISHEHNDHAAGIHDAAKSGLEIYCSAGTAEAKGVTGHRIHHIKSLQWFVIPGGWKIMPFSVEHDAAEPLGFFIVSGQDKLVFLTDTSYCKPLFKGGFTHLLIEANFCDDILAKNIETGRVEKARWKRLKESHMSIARVKDFLHKQDISKLQEVWLIHLSNDNSDESQFKKEVQEITGVPVYVC